MENQKDLSFSGLVGLMLASTLTIMLGSAVVPALPKIAEQYCLGHLSGWVVTVPSIGVALCSLYSGKLIDKFGSYKMALIGLLLSGIFGTTTFLMPNVFLMLLFRFLLGGSAAIVIASSTSLISHFYTGKKQLKMIAVQGMVMQLGGVLFLTTSGRLAEINWFSPFFIYSINILTFIIILLFVPNFNNNNKLKRDNLKSNKAKNSKKNSSLIHTLILTFCVNIIFFTSVLKLPSYLQNDFGYSSTFTGNYIATISLIAVIVIGFIPTIVAKFSNKIDLLIGLAAFSIAHFLLYISDSANLLYCSVIFMGIGFGLTQTLLNNLVVANSTDFNKGQNLSFYSLAMFSGQLIATLISSIFISASGFLVCSIIALFVFIMTLILFEK
ncbi:MAG: MFS transporter [Pleomorphochaeta sp.]